MDSLIILLIWELDLKSSKRISSDKAGYFPKRDVRFILLKERLDTQSTFKKYI